MRFRGLLLVLVAVCVFGVLAVGAVSAGAVTNYGMVDRFGSFSPEESWGVTVDDSSNPSTKDDVYVSDLTNHRVLRFSAAGVQVGELSSANITAGSLTAAGFSSPRGIAVDPSDGDVYVADLGSSTVTKFSPDGTFVYQIAVGGSPSAPEGSFGALGIAVDPNTRDVYVSDLFNNVVDKFASNGTYLSQVGAGEVSQAYDVAVAPNGDLYVANVPSSVRVYSPSGEPVLCEGSGTNVLDGSGPSAVAVDPSDGNVFVVENNESPSVQVAQYTGPCTAPVAVFGSGDFPGEAGSTVNASYGIGVSSAHTVYANDFYATKINIFKQGETPSTPTTKPATEITSSTVLLHGELDPEGKEVGFYFSYNKGLSCTGEGALTTTPDNGEGALTGSSPVEVSTNVTGLEPSTHYTFCVIATNPFGTGDGAAEAFTTLASPPVIDSQSSSSITPFAATLEAQVNPENEDTTCIFQYGPTNTYGTTVPCTPEDLGEGFGDQQAMTSLTGLTPASTYHYRVLVKNATGTTEGADQQLTTLETFAPFIDTQNASPSGNPTVTLEAQINPDYQETTYSFQYANNEELTGATTVPGGTLPAVFGDQAASVNIGSSLTPGIYYYRTIAENATGLTFGAVQSFARVARPVVGETEVQDPTTSTVILSGSVNPQGLATTYRFEIVSEAAYQAALAASAEDPYAAGPSTSTTGIGSDYTIHATGEVIAKELLPGTTYHYALLAGNQNGTTIGADGTFATGQPTPPGATTGPASGVTQNTASITGTIDTQGLPTTYGFEIGLEAGNYGPATGLGSVGAGASNAEVTLPLTGLQPGTTYHYRITATNNDGTSYGTDQVFTTGVFSSAFVTPPAPLPFLTVPSIRFPPEAGSPIVKKKIKQATKKKHKKSRRHKSKPGKHKKGPKRK
jgi:hypothetical protein